MRNSTRYVACLGALLLAAACGETVEPAKDAAAAETSSIGDATADTKDTAAPVDTGSIDTGAPDVPKDTGPVGKNCGELLACASFCDPLKAGDACRKACADQGTTAAATDFAAVGACSVSLCADATETGAARACMWSKCFDKLSVCGGFGAGATTCIHTAACAGRCSAGDAACRFKCLQLATKEAGAAFVELLGCTETACGSATEGAAKGACIFEKCKTAAATCKGAGYDCTLTEGCVAKCAESLPSKPNACIGTCRLLAGDSGLAHHDAYAACKAAKCAGALNPELCLTEQCAPEAKACYVAAGTQNCQAVWNCVKDPSKCNGFGGDEVCIAGCLKDATGVAKEAFVKYEGCMHKALQSAEAKNAGCSFPYDQTTCLDQIGGLCGKQSGICFKP